MNLNLLIRKLTFFNAGSLKRVPICAVSFSVTMAYYVGPNGTGIIRFCDLFGVCIDPLSKTLAVKITILLRLKTTL